MFVVLLDAEPLSAEPAALDPDLGPDTDFLSLTVTIPLEKFVSLPMILPSSTFSPPTEHSTDIDGQAMQAARLELKLSQKDLAAKVNEKVSVLQDYESGKAIPNPQILGKLERNLGVKLRGNDIGKKLEAPGKKST